MPYLSRQVTKYRLNAFYLSLATLPAQYMGLTSSTLQLMRSKERRNLHIQARLQIPHNLFHYHSRKMKTLKIQVQ